MYGKKLKIFRKCLELTQIELAEMFNVSQPCVSGWEKDIFNPSVEILIKLQEICNKELLNIKFYRD